MSDGIARLVIVAVVVGAALLIAWWRRVRAARHGPPIDVGGLVAGPAAVVFTRDDCATCGATLERVGGLGLPVRQVRAEDEPAALAERGITGVPLTVIVDGEGRARGQIGGLPSLRKLRRAARLVR